MTGFHDPGDETTHVEQLAIPIPVEPKRCPRCATLNPAECEWDSQHDGQPWERRPRNCANQYSPETAEIPY